MLASMGHLPLIQLSEAVSRELYQRHFGGKLTDSLWFESKNNSNATCQAMLDLVAKPVSGVFVVPDERAYSLFEPLCTPDMIPFQLITLNENFF